ncbi:hypothetical protein LCGC14_1687650 [marine sediment metagenome]|uniref:Methyltransferase domain-containing protein n=1 Tax=marine sediment metagenome TaxID=412755 RepID=A0A0F9HM59_9ZZZZ
MSSEREKYVEVWGKPAYRVKSPAETHMPQLVKIFRPEVGESLIDWGCGTGRASYELWKQLGLDVTMVDIAYNALDQKVIEAARGSPRLRFITHDISKEIDLTADYSLCCDVMEHLPPDQVDATLDNIIRSSKHTLFVIATFEESVQPDLHLTVRPYRWWLRKLCNKPIIVEHSAEYKYYKDDELHDHIYNGSHAVFYLCRDD